MKNDYQYSKQDLIKMQSWPLHKKIQVTQTRILEWLSWADCNIYISYSGGKDSTVLADLTARIYKNFFPHKPLRLVFVDTGLEYPEIRQFAPVFADWLQDTYKIHVCYEAIRPELSFPQVINQYGYPVISKEVAKRIYYARNGSNWAINSLNGKNKDGSKSDFKERYIKYSYMLNAPFEISSYCCDVMKKRPLKRYEKETKLKPIIATMTEESQQREDGWRRKGCNAFETGKSQPLSFWTNQDVLQYLSSLHMPYCKVYGEIVAKDPQIKLFPENEKLITTGCDRTGCMFCMFGIKSDKSPNRFQRMKLTHPRQYNYCINGGHYENGLLKPDKYGLGIGKVLDYINVAY